LGLDVRERRIRKAKFLLHQNAGQAQLAAEWRTARGSPARSAVFLAWRRRSATARSGELLAEIYDAQLEGTVTTLDEGIVMARTLLQQV
jgi:hypothetical protein